jgi:hypothetical protein
MKYYLIAAALLLGSCTRPPATHPPQSEPIGLDTLPTDTSTDREFVRVNSANPAENGPAQAPVKLHLFPSDAGSTPQQVVRRRLFGLLPAKSAPAAAVAGVPRKCKGCTFNLVAGNQTVAGKKAQVAAGDGAAVVVAAKKAGPVILADSAAQVQLAIAKKGQAAAGDGIHQQQEEVKPGPWPAIIGGVGIVGGIGLVYWLVAGGGTLWLAGLFRRKNATPNEA